MQVRGWKVGFRQRSDLVDLEQKAIQRIRTASEMSLHHYGQPLVCTYSGGEGFGRNVGTF